MCGRWRFRAIYEDHGHQFSGSASSLAAAWKVFSAAGLSAARTEAVSGFALDSEDVASIYSRRLNAATYHKPLRPGEIGCYASHISAWRALVDSGDNAVAIFEDDVEFDPDLPDILRAISATTAPWDMLKLIGRPRERVHTREPFLAGRDLITYSRVPSMTAAYVITAAGARKLLANRPPFGRPVDVDLRHWWECDLDVRGIHPYPVRGAAASVLSTIGSRDGHSFCAHDSKSLRCSCATPG